MNGRFVDGAAFLAILDADDPNHAQAAPAWIALLDGTEGPVTSNYVVVQACGEIQRRLGFEALRSFIEDVLPVVEVRMVTPEQHATALVTLTTARREDLSLVDCTSALVMRGDA